MERELTGTETETETHGFGRVWDESGAPLEPTSAISLPIEVDRKPRIHRRVWSVGRRLVGTHRNVSSDRRIHADPAIDGDCY